MENLGNFSIGMYLHIFTATWIRFFLQMENVLVNLLQQFNVVVDKPLN